MRKFSDGAPDAENRIRSRLQAAFNDPIVGAEAHLRWGYFHLRRGRLEPALAELDAVGEPGDQGRSLLAASSFAARRSSG